MFERSPETTMAGLAAAVGVVCVVIGAIFKLTEVVALGVSAIGLATTMIGFFARSERQHLADLPVVKREISKNVREEVVEQVKDELQRPPS